MPLNYWLNLYERSIVWLIRHRLNYEDFFPIGDTPLFGASRSRPATDATGAKGAVVAAR
jgi:hypothetical protein